MIPFSVLRAEPWPQNSFQLPQFQTHRGFWINGIQENTLESLIEAKKRGSQMCEVDVRLSRDQVPVLAHDTNLVRLRKDGRTVYDLTARELNSLAQIPTLVDVLNHSEVPPFLNIEIKSYHSLNDSVERHVARVIQNAKAESRVLISSFNPFSLWKISSYLPNVPRALLVTQQDDPENSWILKKMVLAPMLSLHLMHFDQEMITNDLIQKTKRQGFKLGVWTVNNRSLAESLLNQGVDSIITDQIWD